MTLKGEGDIGQEGFIMTQ